MIRALIAIVALIALALAAGGLLGARRGLISQREAIHSEWPKVVTAMQERADLAIKLAQTVKAATRQPNPVFDDLAGARAALSSGSTPQRQIQANSRLMQACARLFLVAEEYPKLRSDRDYRRISEELTEAENEVAIERRKYNELLEHYNAQLQRFPDNLVAAVSGFSRIDAYVVTEQEIR